MKKKLVIVALIGIIVGIVIGYGVSQIDFKSDDSSRVNDNKNTEVSSEVKTKLEKFIKAGSNHTIFMGGPTLDEFEKGLTSISQDLKYKMTLSSIDASKITDNYEITKEDVDKMELVLASKDEAIKETVSIIKISDFDNAYKELFDETPKYQLKDLSNISCPCLWGMDKSQDRFYLFSRCGGTSPPSDWNKDVVSYEFDGTYYLAHQVVKGIYTEDNSVIKDYKLLWKFDKDLKFVSTSKE